MNRNGRDKTTYDLRLPLYSPYRHTRHTTCALRLDDADFVGDVNGVVVVRKTNVRLLQAIRANKGVNLHALDVIHARNRILDLLLVGASVDNKDERVVRLNLCQGVFVRQRVLEDLRFDTHTRKHIVSL